MAGSACAQAMHPSDKMETGGAGGLKPPPTSRFNGESQGIRRHFGPSGRPCLTVRGEPRRESANPKLFEHIIAAVNECSRRIKLQACYYQTDHCIAMDIPPYGRDEAILGIMPSMNGFRFEFKEQFDHL
jgi:hypothetical protein